VYEQLRRAGAVRSIQLRTGATGWLVTRYDDVRRALAHPQLSKAGAVSPTGDPEPSVEIQQSLARHMLTTDPPDHTRLRRLVSSAFTPRRVEALRPRVWAIAGDLLASLAGRHRADLIDEFAFPMPLQVICELLGVPVSDQVAFRGWSTTIVAGPAARGELPTAMESMLSYIRQLIDDKRRNPADDLLSDLIAVSDAGDRLTRDELSSTAFLLLMAGHETTVNLIGNGAYHLLTHPAQRRLLAEEPTLLPAAVEEFLRYEGPVHLASFRVTTADIELGGQHIPTGQPVLVSLLSANRDEDRFAHPGQLNITRTDNHHLAFGHGIHFCLGAPLARMEGQVAFAALLRRHPHLRLAHPDRPPTWRPGLLMRGLAHLPVIL
jgi:cytochrome P450